MKIFLDTADIQAIKQWKSTCLIDGVTTNPTHVSKAAGDPRTLVKEISKLLSRGVVSVEITEKDPDAVYAQAQAISKIAKNIIVKIPCHIDYYDIIAQLVRDKIPLNITLLFSLTQALCMAKLGVQYISPFVGRLDDIQEDGVGLLYDIRHMLDTYSFKTKLLAASIRGVDHFHAAIMAGVDAITLPLDVFEKSVHHILTDQGMKKFDADWKKLGVKQFP